MLNRLFRRKQNPMVSNDLVASAIAQGSFKRVHDKPYFLMGGKVFGLTDGALYSFEQDVVLTITPEAHLFLTAHVLSLPATSVH